MERRHGKRRRHTATAAGISLGGRLRSFVVFHPPSYFVVANLMIPTDKSFYCFGGSTQPTETGATNDFHEFNFDTKTWAPVSATGSVPSARHTASLVVWESNGILFGGQHSSGCRNDVHVFDFVLRAWATLVTEGHAPSPRRGHIAVMYSNAMYIFGGYDTGIRMSDFQKLTMGPSGGRLKWHEVSSQGIQKRSEHVGAVYNSSLYIFGGYNSNGRSTNVFSQYRFSHELSQLDQDATGRSERSLVADLRKMVNNELASDITFVVGSAPLYAHKNLCLRCDYFKAMMSGEMLESRTRLIAIHDVSRHVFLLFLEYLYTDDISLSFESATELLVIADRYGVDWLKHICEHRMLAELTVDNSATILYQADIYNATALRLQCVLFMLENFDAVSKTTAFEEMNRQNVELVLELLKRL